MKIQYCSLAQEVNRRPRSVKTKASQRFPVGRAQWSISQDSILALLEKDDEPGPR